MLGHNGVGGGEEEELIEDGAGEDEEG